jgi:hypothetical protein
MRVYPSYIRDLHFSLLLSENLKSYNVFYNPIIDVEKGIDLLINNKYKINLYVKTNKSEYYRQLKYNRHKKDDYVNIDLALDFNNSKKVGRFYLYDKKHVKKIIEIINKYEKIQL